jgi:hypothetical protein
MNDPSGTICHGKTSRLGLRVLLEVDPQQSIDELL